MVMAIRMALAAIFALVATIAVAQQDYRIRSGDVLSIEVLEDSGLNRSVTVLPDGRFSFPLAGTLSAGGRTIGQVQASIADAIGSNFTSPPNVFVGVQPREPDPIDPNALLGPTIDIYMLGEVAAPGLKQVTPGTTFLQALSQAGGLSRFAAQKRIQLRRTDPQTRQQQVVVINYKAITNGAVLTPDFALQEGDVILVPERRLFE
ncbi:polysaccharide biosynthesis/export family protein [uncultured Jannaschia sp.]|uniref:polysaccharide biosynthesis/export family protein n=1 Tax=uncultured Jannaschia sp. TaxID=293347 RepID=UPI00260F095D|nr:polysaccharide biosynthesis/export family protein [uncultured Jannaschia sp.]